MLSVCEVLKYLKQRNYYFKIMIIYINDYIYIKNKIL